VRLPFERLSSLARGAPERLVDRLLRMGPYRTSLAKLRESRSGEDYGPLYPSSGEHVRTPDRRVQLAPPLLVADIHRVSSWLDHQRSDLVLIGRRHVRSNNSWMHNLHVLAKGPDRARLMMSPDDASRRGLRDGARVRVRSRVGQIEAVLTITSDVMPGVVCLPHGFGHSAVRDTMRVAGALAGESANALTDELLIEPVLGTSILNGVPVEVEE
jgi:anaerobic selenocysteine-containing dehydrogenase